ncbi:hypothetical protein [Bradyrhizobium sp.]|uniref:hypothetical protein n=1 Tax=Bradyrhizobium sp. TaxID=376 RepID=UPI0040380DE9
MSGFYGTSSRGFASPAAPDVAICLRPGTEIAFEEEAFREGVLFRRKTGDRVARFRHVDVDNPTTHHDALEFPDGTVVKLNELIVGQRARIVQLPAEPKPAAPKPQPAAQATVEAPEIVTA